MGQRLSAEDVVRDILDAVPDAAGRGRHGRDVTRRASPRVAAYAALAALGLLAALALRRPELAALAAPFAGVLALGLATTRPPELGLWLTVGRERAIEGDDVEASIELNATGAG